MLERDYKDLEKCSESLNFSSSFFELYIYIYYLTYFTYLGGAETQKPRYLAAFYCTFWYGLLHLLVRTIAPFGTVDNFYYTFELTRV